MDDPLSKATFKNRGCCLGCKKYPDCNNIKKCDTRNKSDLECNEPECWIETVKDCWMEQNG